MTNKEVKQKKKFTSAGADSKATILFIDVDSDYTDSDGGKLQKYCHHQAREIFTEFKQWFPYSTLTCPTIFPFSAANAVTKRLVEEKIMTNAQRQLARRCVFYKVWLRQEILRRMNYLNFEREKADPRKKSLSKSFRQRVKKLEDSYFYGFKQDYNRHRRQRPSHVYDVPKIPICPIFPNCTFMQKTSSQK